MDLRERIAAFVEFLANTTAKYFAVNYPNLTPPKFTADYMSDKWCRIVKEDGSSRSVTAFVALQDNRTNALGQVTAGDIHKAAGWPKPAKHKRGSVFVEDFGNCITPDGHIIYLR